VPHQDALTIIANVKPTRVGPLNDVLKRVGQDPARNEHLPFAELPGCHFGRLLFLPGTVDLQGRPIAPQLMLMSDCDGSAEKHLEALIDVAGTGLDGVFGHCEGYPNGDASRQTRLDFFRRNAQPTKANYVHRPGRSVKQVRREQALRTALQELVGQERFRDVAALETRKQIRTFVQSEPDLRWALEAPPSPSLSHRVRNALHATTLPIGLVALGPVVIPAALLVLVLVRLQELRDRSPHIRPTPEHVRALAELEDFVAHNGFTAGGYVKPGLIRQLVLKSVLPLIGYGTRHLFTRDSLAGVKTIHFARWIPLDGGRRVVFCSNYDGSLESYNNDFIDLVAWGLNLVFSNGLGYPETRWLVVGGASHEQEFKDFLRRHQIATPIWYSAYPELTALNIERNAALRAGLRGRMTETEAQRWLRLL
jgi:hypothetical protein